MLGQEIDDKFCPDTNIKNINTADYVGFELSLAIRNAINFLFK